MYVCRYSVETDNRKLIRTVEPVEKQNCWKQKMCLKNHVIYVQSETWLRWKW